MNSKNISNHCEFPLYDIKPTILNKFMYKINKEKEDERYCIIEEKLQEKFEVKCEYCNLSTGNLIDYAQYNDKFNSKKYIKAHVNCIQKSEYNFLINVSENGNKVFINNEYASSLKWKEDILMKIFDARISRNVCNRGNTIDSFFYFKIVVLLEAIKTDFYDLPEISKMLEKNDTYFFRSKGFLELANLIKLKEKNKFNFHLTLNEFLIIMFNVCCLFKGAQNIIGFDLTKLDILEYINLMIEMKKLQKDCFDEILDESNLIGGNVLPYFLFVNYFKGLYYLIIDNSN